MDLVQRFFRLAVQMHNGAAAGRGVEHGKLVVDPKLPAHWNGFTMERLVRGRKTRIIVSKPAGVVTEKYKIKTELL